jgi:hypothetical protein
MFDFLRRSGLRSPSAAMRHALEASDLPPGTDISTLGVVEMRGKYSGRTVTFVRVFDPKLAAARAVNVRGRSAYQDLNAHLDLVLRAGIVEQDGTVVLFAQSPDSDAGIPSRAGADRAAHADDERFVFPDTDESRAQRSSAAVPRDGMP